MTSANQGLTWARRNGSGLGPGALRGGPANRDDDSMIASPSSSRRLSGERGQGSLEYTGIIALVVAAVLALVLLAPGWGSSVGDGIKAAVCKVVSLATGNSCGSTAEASSRKPEEPCAVNKSATNFDASVTIASVKLGGGGHFLETTMSDGSVKVTVNGTALGGAQFGIGEYAGVTVGDTTYGEGATASVSVTANAEAGNTWNFTGPDAQAHADSFTSDAERQTAQDAATHIAPGPLGDLLDSGINAIVGKWDPPKPDSSYVAIGLGANVDGKASFGAGGASGGAGLKGLIGYQTNKDGSSVGYFQVTDELAGKAGILSSAGTVGGSGSVGAKGVVSVTFDAQHHATKLTIQDSLDASGGLTGVTSNTSSLVGMAQDAAFGPGEKGASREVEASLNLTDPANHAAATQFLSAVGINALRPASGQAYQNSYDAGKALLARFQSNGQITVLNYTGDKSGLGVGGEGGLGIEFGADAQFGQSNAHLNSAQYWNGTGWQTWAECRHG